MATTNLPEFVREDSAAASKLFFETYGEQPLEFAANEVNATVAFFEKKGFANEAALVVSTVLLKQAKLDNIPIFKILDTIANFDVMKLSSLVGEILNNNRTATSVLGFRTADVRPNQIRNIYA
jgi:hypothetical protein